MQHVAVQNAMYVESHKRYGDATHGNTSTRTRSMRRSPDRKPGRARRFWSDMNLGQPNPVSEGKSRASLLVCSLCCGSSAALSTTVML